MLKQMIKSDDCPYLIAASILSDVEAVKKKLKDPDVDVNVVTKHRDTALIKTVLNNQFEIFEILLKHPKTNIEKLNEFGQNALMYAATYNRFEMCKMLLQHGADISAGYYYALNIARRNEYSEIVKLFETHIKLQKLY
jgi:ankyrin repeat protein